MDTGLLELAAANGIWAVLFVGLFLYQLNDSKAREVKYQKTIDSLVEDVSVVNDIKEDLEKLNDAVVSIIAKPQKKRQKEEIVV